MTDRSSRTSSDAPGAPRSAGAGERRGHRVTAAVLFACPPCGSLFVWRATGTVRCPLCDNALVMDGRAWLDRRLLPTAGDPMAAPPPGIIPPPPLDDEEGDDDALLTPHADHG